MMSVLKGLTADVENAKKEDLEAMEGNIDSQLKDIEVTPEAIAALTNDMVEVHDLGDNGEIIGTTTLEAHVAPIFSFVDFTTRAKSLENLVEATTEGTKKAIAEMIGGANEAMLLAPDLGKYCEAARSATREKAVNIAMSSINPKSTVDSPTEEMIIELSKELCVAINKFNGIEFALEGTPNETMIIDVVMETKNRPRQLESYYDAMPQLFWDLYMPSVKVTFKMNPLAHAQNISEAMAVVLQIQDSDVIISDYMDAQHAYADALFTLSKMNFDLGQLISARTEEEGTKFIVDFIKNSGFDFEEPMKLTNKDGEEISFTTNSVSYRVWASIYFFEQMIELYKKELETKPEVYPEGSAIKAAVEEDIQLSEHRIKMLFMDLHPEHYFKNATDFFTASRSITPQFIFDQAVEAVKTIRGLEFSVTYPGLNKVKLDEKIKYPETKYIDILTSHIIDCIANYNSIIMHESYNGKCKEKIDNFSTLSEAEIITNIKIYACLLLISIGRYIKTKLKRATTDSAKADAATCIVQFLESLSGMQTDVCYFYEVFSQISNLVEIINPKIVASKKQQQTNKKN